MVCIAWRWIIVCIFYFIYIGSLNMVHKSGNEVFTFRDNNLCKRTSTPVMGHLWDMGFRSLNCIQVGPSRIGHGVRWTSSYERPAQKVKCLIKKQRPWITKPATDQFLAWAAPGRSSESTLIMNYQNQRSSRRRARYNCT